MRMSRDPIPDYIEAGGLNTDAGEEFSAPQVLPTLDTAMVGKTDDLPIRLSFAGCTINE